MAKETYWTNNDGLRVPFGARDTYNPEGASVRTKGREKEVELRITADAYADVASGVLHGKEHVIPAGSRIVSCVANVIETITATTAVSFDMGLKNNVDGTTIDADGLIDGLTNFAVGVQTGAGLLVGTVTAADAVVSFDPNVADLLTGEVIVLVRYIDPVPSSDAPGVITGEI
jgi:hypothetical protein